MEERVEISDFKKEAKRREWKGKIQNGVNKAKDFYNNNKTEVLVIGSGVLSVVGTVIKAVSKHASHRKEQNLKENYCYDRSLGHYWKLRRELTNSEWLEIDRRKKNGERLSDILEELKVLK